MLRLISIFVMMLFIASEANATNVWASWYAEGRRTANGERFNPNGMTAAHKTLKFGTRLLLTYKGRSVIVRINDRGPFIKGRTLDLSRGAARKLGCSGVCKVTMKIIP